MLHRASIPLRFIAAAKLGRQGSIMTEPTVQINRAPVLTLWGAVVAERLGYDTQASLSLGKALAGLNAQAKGRSLGIFHPKKAPDGWPPKKVGLGEEFWIELCGRGIPANNTDDGIRAVVKDKPVDSAGVQQYLQIGCDRHSHQQNDDSDGLPGCHL